MEFYFQIKGKRSKKDPDRLGGGLYGGTSNWVFPPLFSGKVEAKDKEEANEKINKLYGKKITSCNQGLEANYYYRGTPEHFPKYPPSYS